MSEKYDKMQKHVNLGIGYKHMKQGREVYKNVGRMKQNLTWARMRISGSFDFPKAIPTL